MKLANLSPKDIFWTAAVIAAVAFFAASHAFPPPPPPEPLSAAATLMHYDGCNVQTNDIPVNRTLSIDQRHCLHWEGMIMIDSVLNITVSEAFLQAIKDGKVKVVK